MTFGRFSEAIIAAVTLVGVGCCTCVAQSVPEGRLYAFHSSAQGGCPALDWHLVVGAGNSLSGMISWDDMKSLARVSGRINSTARSFSMQAVEVGGQGRSVTIEGTVGQNGWLMANINGPNVACAGVSVPWFHIESPKPIETRPPRPPAPIDQPPRE